LGIQLLPLRFIGFLGFKNFREQILIKGLRSLFFRKVFGKFGGNKLGFGEVLLIGGKGTKGFFGRPLKEGV